MNDQDKLTMALIMRRCDVDAVGVAMRDAQLHLGQAASAFRLISEGLDNGVFEAREGELSGLCGLLSIALSRIEETRGDLLSKHELDLRRAAERAPVTFPAQKEAHHDDQ